MTVTDQIKILDKKIKQNESQYDLDREAAKISALSSNNWDKYELLMISGDYLYSSEEEQEEEQEKQEEKQEKQGEQDKKYFDLNKFIEQIINKEGLPINNELFRKHFKLEKPILMYKVLNETNNDKEKNSKLVNIFDSGLEDLEKEIKEMSQKEVEIEKPYNIVKLVKKILDINKHSQE